MIKKICCLFIVFTFLSSSSLYCECDFSKDIKELNNGSYNYTEDCHIKVGELVQDKENNEIKTKELNEAINLKDEIIKKEEERVNLYKDSLYKTEDRLMTIEKINKWDNRLYFVLGIALTIATGFMVKKTVER